MRGELEMVQLNKGDTEIKKNVLIFVIFITFYCYLFSY